MRAREQKFHIGVPSHSQSLTLASAMSARLPKRPLRPVLQPAVPSRPALRRAATPPPHASGATRAQAAVLETAQGRKRRRGDENTAPGDAGAQQPHLSASLLVAPARLPSVARPPPGLSAEAQDQAPRRAAFARALGAVAATVEEEGDGEKRPSKRGRTQTGAGAGRPKENAELASLASLFQQVRGHPSGCGRARQGSCHLEPCLHPRAPAPPPLTPRGTWQVDEADLECEEDEEPRGGRAAPSAAVPTARVTALGTPTPRKAVAMYPTLQGDYDQYVSALKGRADPMPFPAFVAMRSREKVGTAAGLPGGMPRLPPSLLCTIDEEDHEVDQL